MDKHLHIVSMDVPYPTDYGGVVDIFCKVKALWAEGIQIHLHCFEYGRNRQAELDRYCVEVLYYKRSTGVAGFSAFLPYIVNSRKNDDLLNVLLRDDFPILLEGIHCTYLTTDARFNGRKILLRLFNVEYVYYRELSRSSGSIFKKIYFGFESRLLFNYEKKIVTKVFIATLAEQDATRYRREFNAKRIGYLPVFLPYAGVTAGEGTGTYCLYHGNLSVAENEKVAVWLLENVLNDLEIAFVIAGKNPSGYLRKVISAYDNACLVANPSQEEMQDLIKKAQINILPSFNSTGAKLKLLNALFNGRHCIVNEAAIAETGLSKACHVGSTSVDMKKIVVELYPAPFSKEEIHLRKGLLEGTYNNSTNARTLIQWIW